MQGYRVPPPKGTTTPRPEWARPPSTQSSNNDALPEVIETTRKPTTTEKPIKKPTVGLTKPTKKPTEATTTVTATKPSKKPVKKSTTTTTEKYIEPEFPVVEEDTPSETHEMDCSDGANTEAYFADPKNCKVFYRCNQNQATQFECKDSLVFNPRINTCDWPNNVPSCKNFYLKENADDEEKKTEADNEIDE